MLKKTLTTRNLYFYKSLPSSVFFSNLKSRVVYKLSYISTVAQTVWHLTSKINEQKKTVFIFSNAELCEKVQRLKEILKKKSNNQVKFCKFIEELSQV